MHNIQSAEEGASTLAHEAAHVHYEIRGSKIPFSSQLDEFRAFKRDFLFEKRRRPSLDERYDIWSHVQKYYAEQPVGGKVPPGLMERNVF